MSSVVMEDTGQPPNGAMDWWQNPFVTIGAGSFGSVLEISTQEGLAEIFETTGWFDHEVFMRLAGEPRGFLGRFLGRPLTPVEFGTDLPLEKLLVVKTQFPCVAPASTAQEHLAELNAICAEALEGEPLDEVLAGLRPLVERSGTVAGVAAGATVPTIANEAVAGAVLNNLPDSRHFMKTLFCGFDAFSTPGAGTQLGAALLLERIVPLNNSNILSGTGAISNLYALLFQTVYALQHAQDNVRFMHGDLHIYNLGVQLGAAGEGLGDPYRFWTAGETTSGRGTGTAAVVEKSQYIELRFPLRICAKIIDFGSASFDVSINRTRVRVAARRSAGFVYQYGAFHPMFDLAMLLGPFFAAEIQRGRLPLTLTDYFLIISNCFGMDTSRWTPDDAGVRDYMKTYYQVGVPRPRPEMFGAMRHGSLLPALTFLARQLAALGLPVRSLNSAPIAAQRPFTLVSTSPASSEGAPDFFSSATYTIVDSDGTPLISTAPLSVSNASRLHVVAIDTRHPSAAEWTFATGCCRVDTISIAGAVAGVALNGAFFDPFNDYRPILAYQKAGEQVQANRDGILAAYKSLQGVIVIRGRQLSVLRPGAEAERQAAKADAAFISSPLLLENGQLVFTTEVTTNIDAAHPGRHLFECRRTTDVGIQRGAPVAGVLRPRVAAHGQPTVTYPNCNALLPGELAHASTRAARSMLVLSPTHVYFVVVDGPDNQDFNAISPTESSAGITLYTLAKLTQARIGNVALFPGAQQAIALHGGKNSNLAWNFGRGVVSTSHALPFPGGNILVFAPIRQS